MEAKLRQAMFYYGAVYPAQMHKQGELWQPKHTEMPPRSHGKECWVLLLVARLQGYPTVLGKTTAWQSLPLPTQKASECPYKHARVILPMRVPKQKGHHAVPWGVTQSGTETTDLRMPNSVTKPGQNSIHQRIPEVFRTGKPRGKGKTCGC